MRQLLVVVVGLMSVVSGGKIIAHRAVQMDGVGCQRNGGKAVGAAVGLWEENSIAALDGSGGVVYVDDESEAAGANLEEISKNLQEGVYETPIYLVKGGKKVLEALSEERKVIQIAPGNVPAAPVAVSAKFFTSTFEGGPGSDIIVLSTTYDTAPYGFPSYASGASAASSLAFSAAISRSLAKLYQHTGTAPDVTVVLLVGVAGSGRVFPSVKKYLSTLPESKKNRIACAVSIAPFKIAEGGVEHVLVDKIVKKMVDGPEMGFVKALKTVGKGRGVEFEVKTHLLDYSAKKIEFAVSHFAHHNHPAVSLTMSAATVGSVVELLYSAVLQYAGTPPTPSTPSPTTITAVLSLGERYSLTPPHTPPLKPLFSHWKGFKSDVTPLEIEVYPTEPVVVEILEAKTVGYELCYTAAIALYLASVYCFFG